MLRPRLALSLLLVCLGSLALGSPVWAGGPPDHLDTLTISIWLEYDRPGALYIYRGQLPEGLGLPARLTFRLPGGSGGPSSTAGIDNEGKYRYIRPIVGEDGGTTTVSYDVSWPRFQLEYYEDALQRQGNNRELDFGYKPEYAVAQLVLEIKEPYGASNFVLDPAADTRSQAEDGLTVHRRVIGPVAAGQEVRWRATYSKADSRLAAEALALPTPESTAYESSTREASRRSLPMQLVWGVLGILAIIGAGAVGLVWRASTRPVPKLEKLQVEATKRKRRSRRATTAAGPPRVRPAKYCHQCGATLGKQDAFCRQCGTRRRGA